MGSSLHSHNLGKSYSVSRDLFIGGWCMIPFESRVLLPNEGLQPVIYGFGLCRLSPRPLPVRFLLLQGLKFTQCLRKHTGPEVAVFFCLVAQALVHTPPRSEQRSASSSSLLTPLLSSFRGHTVAATAPALHQEVSGFPCTFSALPGLSVHAALSGHAVEGCVYVDTPARRAGSPLNKLAG